MNGFKKSNDRRCIYTRERMFRSRREKIRLDILEIAFRCAFDRAARPRVPQLLRYRVQRSSIFLDFSPRLSPTVSTVYLFVSSRCAFSSLSRWWVTTCPGRLSRLLFPRPGSVTQPLGNRSVPGNGCSKSGCLLFRHFAARLNTLRLFARLNSSGKTRLSKICSFFPHRAELYSKD